MRVLIVDDHPATGEILAVCFDAAGCESYLATSEREAITLCRRIRPAVAVVEFGRPGLHAVELAWGLRAVQRDLHLVALLDRDGNAHERDFDQYIPKPISLGVIRALLARLQARHTRRAMF